MYIEYYCATNFILHIIRLGYRIRRENFNQSISLEKQCKLKFDIISMFINETEDDAQSWGSYDYSYDENVIRYI